MAILFVFDLVMYGILHSQRMDGGMAMARELTPFNISLLTGAGYQLAYDRLFAAGIFI
jgi:hypothetical protein